MSAFRLRAIAWLAPFGLAILLAGCGATPERAQQVLSARFIGTPVDHFFSKYGMPQQSRPTSDGGTMYSWRGGQVSIQHPAQVQPIAAPMPGTERTHTTTHTKQTGPGTTVTESTSTSFGISLAPPVVAVQPATSEELVCEAQITANAQGIITAFHTTRDTRGGEMGRSRCAEVFKVKG